MPLQTIEYGGADVSMARALPIIRQLVMRQLDRRIHNSMGARRVWAYLLGPVKDYFARLARAHEIKAFLEIIHMKMVSDNRG